MACPVCGSTDLTEVNVRMKQASDLQQVVGSTWDARNMARCDECGVLYDHGFVSDEKDHQTSQSQDTTVTVNCSDCGSLNPHDQDTCSYCGTTLE